MIQLRLLFISFTLLTLNNTKCIRDRGSQLAEYLARNVPPWKINKWCIAGTNRKKLENQAETLNVSNFKQIIRKIKTNKQEENIT